MFIIVGEMAAHGLMLRSSGLHQLLHGVALPHDTGTAGEVDDFAVVTGLLELEGVPLWRERLEVDLADELLRDHSESDLLLGVGQDLAHPIIVGVNVLAVELEVEQGLRGGVEVRVLVADGNVEPFCQS